MKKIKAKSLLKLPIELDFEIGRSQKKLEEVLEFKKGSIIKLENSTKNVIQIYANGKLYAHGVTLRKDGEIYVKVTDVLRKKNRGDK